MPSFLNQKNADQLAAEDAAALEAQEAASKPDLTPLAEYVEACWVAAKQHKDQWVTERLLQCKRQVKGEYSPDKVTQLKDLGGCQQYFNISKTKSNAAASWLRDVIEQAGETPWRLEATPTPTLPESVMMEVALEAARNLPPDVQADLSAELAQATDPEALPETIRNYTLDLYDERLAALQKEAEERMEKHGVVIEDQLTEGRFWESFYDFVTDLSRLPLAVMKGPTLRPRKRMDWKDGEMSVVEKAVPHWERVSPFNFFPAPNMTTLEQGYICEWVHFRLSDLASFRDQEGWDTEAIDAILANPPKNTMGSTIMGESERADMEHRDTATDGGQAVDMVEGIQFWGPVSGQLLSQFLPDVDATTYPFVMAIKIGHHIVKAIQNPDPLGRAPYYVASFEQDPDSLWGSDSIPELMEDCQTGYNAAMRGLVNNVALAQGVNAAVDHAALCPGQDVNSLLNPMGVVLYDGTKLHGSQKAVEFFQVAAHLSQFMEAGNYFSGESDNRTLIPRYEHGNEKIGGAGQTMGGLEMLMNASARGIKALLSAIDQKIFHPIVERLYTWNCQYHEDKDAISGDSRIVTRGAVELLTKQQTRMRQQEFLNNTQNPTDLEIMRIEGRAEVLRQVASGLDMDVDLIIPPREEFQQLLRDRAAAQGMAPDGAPLDPQAPANEEALVQ